MPDLKNKTILILSPQAWGKMFVSKHHYAIELAKRGNTVYFLNPPDQLKVDRTESIEIKASNVHPNLFLIEHCLFFPYKLKFRLQPVFHWLIKFHIKRLLKKIDQPVDIVWSFDIENLYPLTYFKETFRIYHPMDEPQHKGAINAAYAADIIFSVTNEILEKYSQFKVSKNFINHGVSEYFLAEETVRKNNDPIRIGFSGNLLRTDIDRKILLQIIRENEQCIFEFWGSFISEANSTEQAHQTKEFIDSLQRHENVVLHGVVAAQELAASIKQMDAFLICYDVQLDQSKGTNYHKVMEYLATGKVIISNNISSYHGKADLIQMVLERDTNRELPELFKKIIVSLEDYNSDELMRRRKDFAFSNTYGNQLDRIEDLIHEA
jgi:hypothetical protein